MYFAGRVFQILGLVTMPSAVWAGHFARSERASIGIFLASLLVFVFGTLLVRLFGRVKI